ncbi:MAG: GNAT family N-acetyltransferase [Erysipelotrichaceae bacterium]|nr:GNAT family N-acetyltransferase [Erysipelotrichaceae bacterium]
MYQIRKTTIEDLDELRRIFRIAREQMKSDGNPDQWKDDRPDEELILKDIRKGNSYVVENNEKIIGTFAFIIGIDPTYIEIDGSWLNDKEYGTIHRIASDGTAKGLFQTVLDYVRGFGVDIRIDTHEKNTRMLHLLEKYGFVRCGIIITDDGTERIAFQKIV